MKNSQRNIKVREKTVDMRNKAGYNLLDRQAGRQAGRQAEQSKGE